MAISRGEPMPHSPGCPGHSHRRARDEPCEAYRRERAERHWRWADARRGHCTACGAADVPVTMHGGQPYCRTCYNRWQQRDFTGNGPGPGRWWAGERAAEYESVITGLSAAQAARALGVSPRTITRWRALLRTMQEGTAPQGDDDHG